MNGLSSIDHIRQQRAAMHQAKRREHGAVVGTRAEVAEGEADLRRIGGADAVKFR